MIEKITEYFLNKPTRLIELGWVLFHMGVGLIIVGLLGRVGTTTVLTGRGSEVTQKTLAEVYPTLPTWWIPETAGAGLFALVLAFLGAWLILVGKRVKRLMEY